MNWIHNYQLFLFDLDGLLVNTEDIHYQAYIRMCAKRGFALNLDFYSYCQVAHHIANGMQSIIYSQLPLLLQQEPHWPTLYQEKKQAFIDIIQEEGVDLMPGARALLEALQTANINRCVVTHSSKFITDVIRQHNDILNSIPHWLTREDYSQAKPNPECYQKAIAQLSNPDDKIIGFEDSPRGLSALRMTHALPVLICPVDYQGLSKIDKEGILHFPSLENLHIPNPK